MHDAVRLQRVHRVCDFLQRAVDIGQRQRGKEPEAPRIVGHQPRAVSLHSRARPRAFAVAEPDARFADREDRRGDAALVHVLDRLLRRPLHQRRLVLCFSPLFRRRTRARRSDGGRRCDRRRLARQRGFALPPGPRPSTTPGTRERPSKGGISAAAPAALSPARNRAGRSSRARQNENRTASSACRMLAGRRDRAERRATTHWSSRPRGCSSGSSR